MARAKPMNDTWSEDAIAQLRTLWDEGHSGEEIGRRMRLSKNAVVGKANRLGLPPRPSPIVSSSVLPRGQERDAAIVRMRGNGLTRNQISKRLRISVETVDKAFARLGLAPLVNARPRGALALARAQATTEKLRAEAVCRHAQPGDGGSSLAAVAHPIPAMAGDPVRAGIPEAAGDRGCVGVSSLYLPPVANPSRPGDFLAAVPPARDCQWPMWGDAERSTQVFCGAPARLRADGTRCVYCAAHAARAFTRVREEDEEPRRVTRSTFAWGGRAA